MLIALDIFCLMVLFVNSAAVVLSTCIGVRGCRWQRNLTSYRMGVAFCALTKAEAIFVSEADAKMFLKLCIQYE